MTNQTATLAAYIAVAESLESIDERRSFDSILIGVLSERAARTPEGTDSWLGALKVAHGALTASRVAHYDQVGMSID